MTTLELDGFDLTASASPRGGRFTLLDLQGWGRRSNGRERVPRMQQAGSWPSTGYAKAGQFVATGQAEYADPQGCALEQVELGALAGGDRYPMTVVNAAGAWTRIVEVDDLDVVPVNDTLYDWTLTATACDPLLYGPTAFGSTDLAAVSGTGLVWPWAWPLDWGVPAGVTPGSVSVANNGTASYFPTVQIDGPVTNPVVTLPETGDRLAYSGVVEAGQFLAIDCARRRVVLAARSQPDRGISRRQQMSYVGSWLAIPVGGATVAWTADDANPAATLNVWSYEGAWS